MTTDDLLRRLDELGAELKVRDRPEQRAWNQLEPTKSGWTTKLYDNKAFTLWKDALRRFPDDLRTVHHLAIMHHARAVDVEQSEHPVKSDQDWQTAMAHWHRLYEADAFWAELAKLVDVAEELVPQVRQDLAERLLRLHFDIALDEQSPHNRGRFHVRLALGSQFPRELVEQVRLTAYERAIDGIDTAVWAPGTVEPEVIWPAIERVIRYLELDEQCAAALTDLFKLLRKAQVGLVFKANSITDKDESNHALDEIRAVAAKYETYVKRVEKLLLEAAEPDELVLSELASWHARVAQACDARGSLDEAARWFDRARRAAEAGADPRADEFHADWTAVTALNARDQAIDEPAKARKLLASIAKSGRLCGFTLLIRGQTWQALDEFDKAERDAEEALTALASPLDYKSGVAAGDPVKMRALVQRLLTQIRTRRAMREAEPHLEKATQALKAERWTEARRELDTVLALDSDSVAALVLRAECHYSQFEVYDAQADLDRAEQVVRSSGGGEQALGVIKSLRGNVATRLKHVRDYGGPRATQLQQKAVKSFNDGKTAKAIELMREARAAARPKPTKQLNEELAEFLSSAAVELVDPLMKGTLPWGGLSETEALVILLRAEGMLTEAVPLSLKPIIRQNLTRVAEIRRILERLQ